MPTNIVTLKFCEQNFFSGGNIGQEMLQGPNNIESDPSSGSTSTQRSGTNGANVVSDDGTRMLPATPPSRFKWCGKYVAYYDWIIEGHK